PLGALAAVRLGKDVAAGQAWQAARQEDRKTNRMEPGLAALASWPPCRSEAPKLRRNTYDYFRRNASRMRYQRFLSRGYHIGSGGVEAPCKRVVAQRLDQAGMHWRQETAEAMVRLRAALLSRSAPDLRPYCQMQA